MGLDESIDHWVPRISKPEAKIKTKQSKVKQNKTKCLRTKQKQILKGFFRFLRWPGFSKLKHISAAGAKQRHLTWYLLQQSWKEKSWEGCCRDIWVSCIQSSWSRNRTAGFVKYDIEPINSSFCEKIEIFVLTRTLKAGTGYLTRKQTVQSYPC